MSTQTREEGEPPRLPLDVMLGYRTPEGMFVDEFVVVRPGDDDYEHDRADTGGLMSANPACKPLLGCLLTVSQRPNRSVVCAVSHTSPTPTSSEGATSPMIQRATFALVALILALAMTMPGSVASHVHAASPRDQNIGQWDYTCRVDQINTYETITVGSDVRGPLGNLSYFAAGLCNAFLNAASNSYNNGYEMFPLTQPRPGNAQCAYVYRYGGYWEALRPPYADSRGAVIISIRDTPDDTAISGSSATYGQADCGGISAQLDNINAQNGYNTTDQPLAPIESCTGCGGGGGGPSSGFNGTLPKPPKAKHPAKKPLHCVTAGNGKKTCHR